MLVLSDSTGVGGQWPWRLANHLAATYQTWTIRHVAWVDGETTWRAPMVVQSGSGPRVLTVYNGSVGRTNTRYHQTNNFPARVTALRPDLVFVSHGHNFPPISATEVRSELLALTELVSAACPEAEMVMVAQNPRADGRMRLRQAEVAKIAQWRGYGFVDVYRALLEQDPGVSVDPSPGALLAADGVHPNAAGQTLFFDSIRDALDGPLRSLGHQAESSFAVSATNLVANGNFADFAAPPTLPNWTAINVAISRDSVNYEGSHGWSVRGERGSNMGGAYIQQKVRALGRLRGQLLTAAARVFVPTANNGHTVGHVEIYTDCGSGVSSVALTPLDEWLWVVCTHMVPSNAAVLQVRLHFERAYNFAGAPALCSFDRVIVALGRLPRDM
jgi:lysophospholipase L1-like esterase